MKPKDDVEKTIQDKLNFAADADLYSRMLKDVLNAHDKSRQRQSASPKVTRGTIMKKPVMKFAAAAVIIIGILFSLNLWDQTIPTASATEVLQNAIDAVSDLWSVHMKTRMRTLPRDNFSIIGLNFDFVDIEMWKRTDENGQVQWRVEKPGRILLMDGQSTIMFIPPNFGIIEESPLPLGCFDSWSGRLLNVHDLLDNELQMAKKNPDRAILLWQENIEGKDKIVLEVDIAPDIPEGDYLKNRFIQNSDHVKVYQFDAQTELLESFRVYLHTEDEDVLIFEVTDIEYNTEIDDNVFSLELPENMVWYKETEILPDNEKYEQMKPKEVAQAFFQACADEDWDEFLKFRTASEVDQRTKDYLGGLEIISIGEPFKSDLYSGWFIPYEIKLKSGYIRKHNLAIRNDNPAKRYVVDGGI
jgi:hypothetical protein